MNFYVAVVLYNTDVRFSITCNSISKVVGHNIKIYIMDNSIINNSNETYAHENNWAYINMNGNAGLPKAYNRFLDCINNEEGIVIFMDDDTMITQEYFDELENAVNNRLDCDIFSPTIVGQDGKIWSPNKAGFLKNKLILHDDEQINDKEYNAINSCTAVRMHVFDNYRYDERMFMDQVDHKFYYDQRKLKRKFCRLKTVIQQQFSQMGENIDAESLWKRMCIRLKDIMEYGKIMGGKYKLLSFFKCCGISLQLSLRVKSVALLKKTIGLCFKLYFGFVKGNKNE